MSNVIIGPRYSGKTETGKILADLRGVEFVDADQIFEKEYGSVDEFVSENGWLNFRKAESQIIGDVCTKYSNSDIVFSLGGGAVANSHSEEHRQMNVDLLKTFGKIVYLVPYENLELSCEVLSERIPEKDRSRPSLGKSMLEILRERDPIYRSVADIIIYTERLNQERVAQRISEALWRKSIKY